MEHQKNIFLDNASNQPSNFKTKNQVEINDESRGTYGKDNQIKFKTSTLRSSFRDYSDAYILIIETITVAPLTTAAPNNANKKVTFKNCVAFINCMRRINNTQVDDVNDNGEVMQMYTLIEYSDNYSKTSRILWQQGPYIYDFHTKESWGSLEICHVFADSINFKQQIYWIID